MRSSIPWVPLFYLVIPTWLHSCIATIPPPTTRQSQIHNTRIYDDYDDYDSTERFSDSKTSFSQLYGTTTMATTTKTVYSFPKGSGKIQFLSLTLDPWRISNSFFFTLPGFLPPIPIFLPIRYNGRLLILHEFLQKPGNNLPT